MQNRIHLNKWLQPLLLLITYGFPPWGAKAQCPTSISNPSNPNLADVTIDTDVPGFTICGSTRWSFFVDYPDGLLYEWEILGPTLGSIVAGNYTDTIEVLFNNPQGYAQYVGIAVAVTKCGTIERDTMVLQLINAPPYTVTPTATTVCADEEVDFSITPTPTGYASLTWEFGDGETSTNPSPTYAYSGTGSVAVYDPVVTIVHPAGCLSTVVLPAGPISVKPTPVALISPGSQTGCGPFNATLTATVTTGFGSTTNYNWSGPGPGDPNCGTCTTWNIDQYGTYYVVVTNSNGCSGVSHPVHVFQNCGNCPITAPTPYLVSSSSSYVSCARVSATVSYNANGSTIVDQFWGMPDEANNISLTTGTTATATADFDTAGFYSFKYKVIYTDGIDTCGDSYNEDVYVPFVGNMKYEVDCGTGTDYVVTLYDHSNIYAAEVGYINRSYAYNDGTGWTSITAQPNDLSAIVSLPGGDTYQIREIISSSLTPAAPPCTTTVSVELPAKPLADFTIDSEYMPACINDVVIHFNNTSTPGAINYVWNFGDGLNTNFQANPSKVYSAPGPIQGAYLVSLTTTNTIGCTDATSQTLTVVDNGYWDGDTKPTLGANPDSAVCPGTPVMLSYQIPSQGMDVPSNFTWHHGTTPITDTVPGLSTYPATLPGYYWVMGSDAFGCLVPSEPIQVSLIPLPPVAISGDPIQCDSVSFTLYSSVLGDSTMTYSWMRDSVVLEFEGSTIGQELPQGTYTYTLTVGLNGCQSVSSPFTVTVMPPPPPTDIDFAISCAPYTVEFGASNAQNGVINWSNGDSGTHTTTHAGGSYSVTFTSESGCTRIDSIYVPKSPEHYLWYFPTGCFCDEIIFGEHCRKEEALGTILGPLPTFEYWAWLHNGSVVTDGQGTVYPLGSFNFAGTYNLLLDNGYCHAMSGDLYYVHDCTGGYQQVPGIRQNQGAVEAELLLTPNPAGGQSRADYRITGAIGHAQRVVVYGPLGRKVDAYPIDGTSGSLVLHLGDYTPGVYQVVLITDEKVLTQTKLSVTR